MRRKEEKCLICLKNNATQTGSHLMPAGLSAPCDGGRNKEEIIVITINNETKPYFGPNNYRNNNIIHDTTRHRNFNVMDYVFCPSCEKKLAVIENCIIPFLTNTVQSDKFESQKITEGGLTYRTYNNVDLAELKLFFYTVIWRLGLQQELNFGTRIFSEKQYNDLRHSVNEHLSFDLKAITNNKKILNNFPLTIITTNFPNTERDFYNPVIQRNEQLLFFACEYLLHINFSHSVTNGSDFDLPNEVFNESVANKGELPIKIIFLDYSNWSEFIKKQIAYVIDEKRKFWIESIMNKSGKTYKECDYILHKKAFEIQIEKLMNKSKVSREYCLRNHEEREELTPLTFALEKAFSQIMEQT